MRPASANPNRGEETEARRPKAKLGDVFLMPIDEERVGGNRIDCIFASPDRIEVLGAALLDRKYWPVSDHVAYFVEFRFPKSKPESTFKK